MPRLFSDPESDMPCPYRVTPAPGVVRRCRFTLFHEGGHETEDGTTAGDWFLPPPPLPSSPLEEARHFLQEHMLPLLRERDEALELEATARTVASMAATIYASSQDWRRDAAVDEAWQLYELARERVSTELGEQPQPGG